MNILFLSLGRLENLEADGIYSSLIKEFRDNQHNVYIVSARERKNKLPTVREKIDGVNFLKVKTGNLRQVNIVEKGISTVLIEKQYLKAIKKYYNGIRFDLIIYTTPPINYTNIIKYFKRKDDTKTYLLLKDIFPQNAVDLGLISKNGLMHKYFRTKEKKLYELSDFIGGMSLANKKYILEKNPQLSSEKVEISPNTIRPKSIDLELEDKRNIRRKYNIPTDKKVYIYGGNLGKAQGINFLIECIRENEKNKNTFFVIVGTGTEFLKLNNYLVTNHIQNTILLKYLPKEDYDLLVHSSDIGLIFLDKRFTIPNFPSRLLSYMQAKLPVLAAIDPYTDIGDIIEEGEFGYSCISDDASKFNELVNKLANEADLKSLGQNAWNYLNENYTTEQSYEIIMSHFEEA